MKNIILSVLLSFSLTSQAIATDSTGMILLKTSGHTLKCVAALAWSIPTLIGMGAEAGVIGAMDIVSSLNNNDTCFALSNSANEYHKQMLASLFDMGCVAPIDDNFNPIYYNNPPKEKYLVLQTYSCANK